MDMIKEVYSDTWLDDLKISDQCVCDNAVPPPKPATPLELVFVLDGSDSYNTEAQGVDGKITPESSFEYSAAWIADFLTSANFSKYPAVIVSVVQFSGNKVHEKTYKPGSGGVASVSVDGVKDYHYKVIVPPSDWRYATQAQRTSMAGTTFGQEQLDGNCQMYLCLQDLAMPNFLTSMDKVLPKIQGGYKSVERAIVVLSNANNWDDIKNLKRHDGPLLTDSTRVCQLLHKAYNLVIPIMIQETDNTAAKQRFVDSILSKPNGNNFLVNNREFSVKMAQVKEKLTRILGL